MKSALVCLVLLPSAAVASGLSVGIDSRQLDFDHLQADTKGASVNYSFSQAPVYLEASFQKENESNIEYMELSIGAEKSLYRQGPFSIEGSGGIGIGSLDIPWSQNENTLLSAPIGIKASYAVTERFSLYTGAEYRWYFDLTDETKCEDGSTSQSTGAGTCSWHGGISHYQNRVGDGDSLGLRAGLRYNGGLKFQAQRY